MMTRSPKIVFAFAIATLICFSTVPAWADIYHHGYHQPGSWGETSAWVTELGDPATEIPGEDDIAYLWYGIQVDQVPEETVSVGTLIIDTYITWGPAPELNLYGKTLNIEDGGQWMWGGFNDYSFRKGVINQYGTFQLVDDIADHYGNGSEIVDAIAHSIQWKTTFNNYGVMQQIGQGSFNLGADSCRYNNYSVHEFVGDTSITDIGHGGERVTNIGTIRKTSGAGVSSIITELDNQGAVEVLSGTLRVYESLQFPNTGPSGILNGGKWVASNDASLEIYGDGNFITNNQGHLVFGSADANIYAMLTGNVPMPVESTLMMNEGTLEVYGDRTFAGLLFNSGSMTIGDDTTVTVDLLSPGTLDVGNSPGEATIDGNYGNGTLNIELGGLLAGDEYDVLNVTGIATLGGTLNLSYYDGFVAEYGDSFEILHAGILDGTFDTVIYPDSQAWAIGYDTVAGTVTVEVIPEPSVLVSLLILLATAGVARLVRRR